MADFEKFAQQREAAQSAEHNRDLQNRQTAWVAIAKELAPRIVQKYNEDPSLATDYEWVAKDGRLVVAWPLRSYDYYDSPNGGDFLFQEGKVGSVSWTGDIPAGAKGTFYCFYKDTQFGPSIDELVSLGRVLGVSLENYTPYLYGNWGSLMYGKMRESLPFVPPSPFK